MEGVWRPIELKEMEVVRGREKEREQEKGKERRASRVAVLPETERKGEGRGICLSLKDFGERSP